MLGGSGEALLDVDLGELSLGVSSSRGTSDSFGADEGRNAMLLPS